MLETVWPFLIASLPFIARFTHLGSDRKDYGVIHFRFYRVIPFVDIFSLMPWGQAKLVSEAHQAC